MDAYVVSACMDTKDVFVWMDTKGVCVCRNTKEVFLHVYLDPYDVCLYGY